LPDDVSKEKYKKPALEMNLERASENMGLFDKSLSDYNKFAERDSQIKKLIQLE